MQLYLEKFQSNHKLQDIQQKLSESELNKLSEQYAMECLKQTGSMTSIYNKIREKSFLLIKEKKYGEAINNLLQIVADGQATAQDYNTLGWSYILTN